MREYVVDFNATQAAIRSGYSAKTAGAIGTENLQKPTIQEAIRAIQEKRDNAAILTYEQACEILTRKAIGSVADYRTPDGRIDEEALRTRNPEAVQALDMVQVGGEDAPAQVTKFRLCDSIRAVELLAKLRGWNAPERIEYSGRTEISLASLKDEEVEALERIADRLARGGA